MNEYIDVKSAATPCADLAARLTSIFAGREDELAQLRKLLSRARTSRGSFILISGEAGVGKSALVHEFSKYVRAFGAVYLPESFRCDSAFEPYAPFYRILEKLTAEGYLAEEKFKQVTRANLMARAEHDAGAASWDAESLYHLQTEHRLVQQRLLSSVLEVAQTHILVIAFFDLHLAPQSTWRFIHYLCESLPDHKLVIITTLRLDGKVTRPAEVPVYHEILQRMNRERLVEKITLRRWSPEEVKKLLFLIFQRTDFSSQFLPALYEVTGGVPQRVLTCLQKMCDTGVIYQQNGIWFDQELLDRDRLLALMSEEQEQTSLQTRVDELPEEDLRLLRYAACMRESFDIGALSQLMQLPRIQLLKRLEAFCNSRLLVRTEADGYDFKDPATRMVALQRLSPAEKSGLHLEVARAIEVLGSDDQAGRIYHLSYLFVQANVADKALEYLLKAIEVSIHHFAFPEARCYLQQALHFLAEGAEIAPAGARISFYLKAGWLERVLGNWRESLAHLQIALQLCEKQADDLKKMQTQIQLGLTYFRLNEWEAGQNALSACIETPAPLRDFDRAMAYYGLGNIKFELAHYEAATEMFEKALQLAREINAPQLIANIYNNLGAIQNVQNNRLKAISYYSKSIPLFDSLGDSLGLARVYHNIGMTHADEKHWQEANKFYSKSLAMSDMLGLMPLKAITFLNRAYALVHLHRFEEAREYNFKALRLLRRIKDDLGLAEYHKIQGVIEREQSNWRVAGEHFARALERFTAFENKLGVAETTHEMALLHLALGNQPEAAVCLKSACEGFGALGILQKAKQLEQELEHLVLGNPTPQLYRLNNSMVEK